MDGEPQAMLDEQQVTGGGDRQKLGDSFHDTEQDDDPVGHRCF